ncbi:MAG: hypothetical protein HRT61_21535 [Ekhidna sp.]|nr:hypothetical protein [Ekhidna sp.]
MSDKKETPLNPNDFGEVSLLVSESLVEHDIRGYTLTKDKSYQRYKIRLEDECGSIEFPLTYYVLKDVEDARRWIIANVQKLQKWKKTDSRKDKLKEALKLIKEALDE